MSRFNRRQISVLTLAAMISASCGTRAEEDTAMSLQQSWVRRLQSGVDKGHFPGACLKVVKGGAAVVDVAAGQRGPGNEAAIGSDSIFRIYEMTQSFVAVAALKAIEDGKITFDTPITEYLPELEKTYIGLKTHDEGSDDRERNYTDITIYHLLSQTSGYLGPRLNPETNLQRRYNYARLEDLNQTSDEFIDAVDDLPLGFAPGEGWAEGVSLGILSAAMERVFKKPLDVIIREEICQPLGLRDTSFSVSPETESRLANPSAEALLMPRAFRRRPNGMLGLFSTPDEYLTLLKARQSRENSALLSPGIIKASETDVFSNSDIPANMRPAEKRGYGLGQFIMYLDRDGESLPIYYYAGRAGTLGWYDPQNDVRGVFMIQSLNRAQQYHLNVITDLYDRYDDF